MIRYVNCWGEYSLKIGSEILTFPLVEAEYGSKILLILLSGSEILSILATFILLSDH